MHKLTFNIEPVPASRPRVTRYATFYAKPYEAFRNSMAKMLMGKQTLYEEPLRLDVTFYRKIPVSYGKGRRQEMHDKYFTVKPDLDNYEKALYDSMNGVVWKDDSQIVEHTTRKKWTLDNPRIEVIIERL